MWKEQPGKFFCISTKDMKDDWKDTFFSPEEFSKVKQFILDNEHKNIYFCPHGFNRRSRSKTEAVLPNLLWADLDFADPRKLKLKPTIAIESSPGRFVGIWVLKGTMTESMNRRMSYMIDADHGGWDLTQALRMPGTRNYKYKSEPRVKGMWDDGRTYSIKQIEAALPPEEEIDTDPDELNPVDVWEEHEKNLPRWLRRELMAKKILHGADRSEMLWKLENACIEAGLSTDEAFALIKRSIWNKFRNRRNGDAILRNELSKIVNHQFSQAPKGKEKLKRKSDADESREEVEGEKRFNFRRMTEVKKEELDFVWYPYLVRGEVSIVEGDPGLGKSYLMQMVAAHIAKGKRLPSPRVGKNHKVQGTVVYFDMENSAGSVTKPRLEQNGMKKLEDLIVMNQFFTIDDEDAMEEIYDALEIYKPTLVVFDTLNAYIGRADTHKASESTAAINRFADIARQFNCAVVVLRHLTKGSGSAMYRGQGSIAFSGTARVVMSVGVDPADTENRAVAITKINFAKAPRALTFRIEERPKEESEFIFGEYTDLSAQEIMDAASNARAEGKVGDSMQEAMEFLEEQIAEGPMDKSKLFRMAETRSVSSKLLERAAARMGVVKEKERKGSSKVEMWSLKDPSKKTKK
jgi:archaellum biogenesis ATPase FlaH